MRDARKTVIALRILWRMASKPGTSFSLRSAANSPRTIASNAGRGRTGPSAWSTFSTAGICRTVVLLRRLIDDVDARFSRSQDAANHRAVRRAMALHTFHPVRQLARRNAEKQSATSLRVREQNFLSFCDPIPVGELIGKIQIVTAAPWHAFLLNERENFRADGWHARSKDFRGLLAGAAHRTRSEERRVGKEWRSR